MTAEYDPAGNAVRVVMEQARENEIHSGGHSWGFTAWTPGSEEGSLVTEKGVGRIPLRNWPDATLAIGHTRLATRGRISQANAHPFEIEVDGEVRAALCHNGTWRDAPPHATKSDTRLMAMLLESIAQTKSIETAIRETAEVTGETFLVITSDGRVFCHAGRFPITFDPTRPAFASSGFLELAEGDIMVLQGDPTDTGKKVVEA